MEDIMVKYIICFVALGYAVVEIISVTKESKEAKKRLKYIENLLKDLGDGRD